MLLETSPLYPILDASYLPASMLTPELATRLSLAERAYRLPGDEARHDMLSKIVLALADAGVTMLQYRNKTDVDAQILRDAKFMREQAPKSLRILLNDRVHLVRESGCDGVHLGQTDMRPSDARMFLGAGSIIGLSTHDSSQVRAGDLSTADYLAVGPIYATGTKADAEAVVGVDGLRQVRALTAKPLVAIGGITLARAAEVRAAGADSLAVISALFAGAGSDGVPVPLEKLAKDFLEVFR